MWSMLFLGLRGPVVRMALSSFSTADGMNTPAFLLKSHLAGAGRLPFTVKIAPDCLIGGQPTIQQLGASAKFACGVSTAIFNGFRRYEPLCDPAGAVVRWYGTWINIEDSKQKELLGLAGQRALEMIADGASLSEILNELCSVVDIHASATSQVLLMD